MSIEAMNEAWYLEKQKNPHTAFNSWCRGYEAGVKAIEQAEKQFNPDWDQQAVLVERIRELEAQLYGQAEKQEPVAYRKEAHGMWFYIEKKPSPPNDDYAPLYTAPPRKEWVGLTELEIAHGLEKANLPAIFSYRAAAKAGINAFKEKNT